MNELKDISEINREIRSIVSVAENIGQTATNAMLVAKQEGINAEGFNMVARELRMYSKQVSVAMQGLSGLVDWQAEVNVSKRRQVRKPDLQVKAGAGGGLPQTHMTPVYACSQVNIDEVERLIISQVRDLMATINRTGKQCASGLMIARSANIEAASGEAMTPVLSQIAQDVEAVIDNISEHIRKLEVRLTEVGL